MQRWAHPNYYLKTKNNKIKPLKRSINKLENPVPETRDLVPTVGTAFACVLEPLSFEFGCNEFEGLALNGATFFETFIFRPTVAIDL